MVVRTVTRLNDPSDHTISSGAASVVLSAIRHLEPVQEWISVASRFVHHMNTHISTQGPRPIRSITSNPRHSVCFNNFLRLLVVSLRLL